MTLRREHRPDPECITVRCLFSLECRASGKQAVSWEMLFERALECRVARYAACCATQQLNEQFVPECLSPEFAAALP